MLISVVIPHFNQENHLRIGLERLHAQVGCGAEVELIVVDNASRRLPEAIVAAFPGVTLLSETTPGPGPARNTGAARAKGDVLAFIDADCHAEPGWLAAIEAHFRDPAAQVAGGDVRVGYADPARPTFIEPYEAIYSYRNRDYIAKGFSGTGNLAMRSAILTHVGPFAGIGVAEDRDWGLRAGALGYRTVYLPKMIVYHPARDSFRELTRKWDRHTAHDFADWKRKPLGRTRWLLRALAMAASPLAEIPTVLTSRRVSGGRERLLAFMCLCAIRLYRTRAMLGVMLRGDDAGRAAWRP
jgi:glycosyltransferase involved in cell wall biosynthesis